MMSPGRWRTGSASRAAPRSCGGPRPPSTSTTTAGRRCCACWKYSRTTTTCRTSMPISRFPTACWNAWGPDAPVVTKGHARMPGLVRLIGIDPGLRCTGWGVIECAGPRLIHVANGTVTSTQQASLAERLVEIHDGLAAVIAEFRPAEAAVELTFVNKDAGATLKLGHAR